MQPGAPKWEQRAEITFGQTVEISIMTAGLDLPMPAFDVYVSREHGTTVKLLFVSKDNVHVLSRAIGSGLKEFYLKFESDVLRIFPGTYIVRVRKAGQLMVEKYLSVLDSPTSQTTLPAQSVDGSSPFDFRLTDTDDGSVMVYRKDTQRFENTNEPNNLNMDGGRF